MNLQNNFITRIRNVIERYDDIDFATVFGSLSSGNFRDSSDVDIAIAGQNEFSPAQMLAIKKELTVALGREVDLLDLRRHAGVILKEALCKGKVVLKRDPVLYGELIIKMLYNQADMMPYYRRLLRQRREVFLNGW